MANGGGRHHVPAMQSPPVVASDGHDNVVIGGSAGAVDAAPARRSADALQQIVAAFPADLEAAVCLVIHTAPDFESALPEILSRRSALKATHAIHGEPIAMGRIYVAPPDNHLQTRPGYLAVQRGPKENGARPAVDGQGGT